MEEEIAPITECLLENAYPMEFIHKYANTDPRVKYDGMEKRTGLLYLRLKGDEITGIYNRRINSALQ